ncbi:MAG: hypothetical protein PF440_07110 [Thiomicrorhabdus sp.]|jgi:hypothetical protein|nr:hypothetical protein [Thiomicrorhabdus sp.]
MADYTSTHTGAVVDSSITKANKLAAIAGGDALKVPRINTGETAQELIAPGVIMAAATVAASAKATPVDADTIALVDSAAANVLKELTIANLKATIGVPSGSIVMWSGAISAIPTGWSICDGTGSTPNLTDSFVIHADADAAGTNNVGETGGSNTIAAANLPVHTHDEGTLATASDGIHTHELEVKLDGTRNYGTSDHLKTGEAGQDKYTKTAGAHTHAITGSTGDTGSANTDYKPKYYALAYIMKD